MCKIKCLKEFFAWPDPSNEEAVSVSPLIHIFHIFQRSNQPREFLSDKPTLAFALVLIHSSIHTHIWSGCRVRVQIRVALMSLQSQPSSALWGILRRPPLGWSVTFICPGFPGSLSSKPKKGDYHDRFGHRDSVYDGTHYYDVWFISMNHKQIKLCKSLLANFLKHLWLVAWEESTYLKLQRT